MSKKAVKNYKEMSEQFHYEMAMTFLNDSKYKYDKPYFNDIHNEVTCEISVNGNYDFRLWFFMEKGKYEIEIINYAKETSKTILKSNNLQMIIGDLFLYVTSGKYEKEVNKPAYKIINNNIDKTIKDRFINKLSKDYYIIDNTTIYKVVNIFEKANKFEQKKELESQCKSLKHIANIRFNFKKTSQKEILGDDLNLSELKNIVLSGTFLLQLQAYLKDGFKIIDIKKDNSFVYIDLGTAKLKSRYFIQDDICKKTALNTDNSADFVLTSDDISKFKIACSLASKDESRAVLTGISINQNKVSATDGVMLFTDVLSFNTGREFILNSADLLPILNQLIKNKSMEASLKICGEFALINDLKVEFISGNYPVLENVIPFNTQNIIQFKKADLPKKITVNEITKLFRLTSEGLQSKDSYTDSVTNFGIKINANCKFNIALNWNKFNTILKQIKTEYITIKLDSPQKPIIINDNFILMVINDNSAPNSCEKIYNTFSLLSEKVKVKREVKSKKTTNKSVPAEPVQEGKIEVCRENLTPKFCFTYFAIYYLIANLEQKKQSEKPLKNLLPVLYKAEQKTKKEINRVKLNYEKIVKQITVDNKIKAICERALKNLKALEYDFIMQISAMKKTPLKSISKPLQIEFKKQVLSLPCKQVYLLPSPAAVSLPAEKPKSKDHFADFTELYLAKVREKKLYRKANSKFAVVFQQIGQFSSVACLMFLFLNSFIMIEKNKNTFENLAKMESKQTEQKEIAKEPIKTMSNLSDNMPSGAIYRLDSKTAKNGTSDGLKWISLAVFGMIKRKEEKMKEFAPFNVKKVNKKFFDFFDDSKYDWIKNDDNAICVMLNYSIKNKFYLCGNYLFVLPVKEC